MPDVTFLGGPCSGQQNAISDADVAAGQTVCRGTSYSVYRTGADTLYAVAPTQAAPTDSDGLPATATGEANVITTSSALGGWNTLMHELDGGLSASLTMAHNARRQIRGL